MSADANPLCVTVGDNSQRLVGMHLPNVAVDTVLENLRLINQRQFGQEELAKPSTQTSYPTTWPEGSIVLD